MPLRTKMLCIVVLTVSTGSLAFTEPVNVEISGNTRIRGNYFNMDSIGDARFIQQNTRLSIKMNFTNDVSAVVDADSAESRGRVFRATPPTGAQPVRNPAFRRRGTSRNR